MLKNLTKILLPIFATSLFVEFYEGEKEVYIASFLLLALLPHLYIFLTIY